MLSPEGEPLARRYYSEKSGDDLKDDDMVRGFELEKDRYVIVTDEELERLAPEQSRDIDLRRFAPLEDISPLFFDRSYFLAPSEGSEKAYRLLAQTMGKQKLAGLATFVMRGKEYLVAIFPENGILRAETMRFVDEIRSPKEIGLAEKKKVSAATVKKFERLIGKHSAAHLPLKDLKDEQYRRIASEYGVANEGDLLAGIGYGKYSAKVVVKKHFPLLDGAAPVEDVKESTGIGGVVRRVFGISGEHDALKVQGHDELLVYRARCCNPIRGEEIVGYVTRGKGVAVHSKSCPNVTNLMYESDRRIFVEWAKPKIIGGGKATYPVKLTVFCDDRAGLLKQLTAVISDDNTNIRHMDVRTDDHRADIDVTIDIEDVKHLDRIVSGIRKIPGILDVQRVKNI